MNDTVILSIAKYLVKGTMNNMKIEEIINTVICGDAIKIMREIPDKYFELTITDPPYNAKDIGPNHRVYSEGKMQLPDVEYKQFCKDWFGHAIRISKKLIFTPGISNTHNYPQPFWQICRHKPSSVSFNRMGGFNAWEPIFCYGEVTKAKLGQDYIKFDSLNLRKGILSDHPCPKPINLWKFLIKHFSEEEDIVFDPFLGSGTTAVACKELARRFIGIDISAKYVDIANKRLAQEMLL